MRTLGLNSDWHRRILLRNIWRLVPALMLLVLYPQRSLYSQTANRQGLAEEIQVLTDSMTQAQAQLEQTQGQLDELRRQLAAVQRQIAADGSSAAAPQDVVNPPRAAEADAEASAQPSNAAAKTTAAIDDLRDRQALQESQIATHEQTKVESDSKYPLKITGLILLNGFVNTRQVDSAATPTVAVPGAGSTGASLRQTQLGFAARGPHLFKARSYADISVDFDGIQQAAASPTNYNGSYGTNTTLLRLRTAHAGLDWQKTWAYFSLDRPIISPETPTSLTAVAEPALAWSGNLWTWNPQVGITHDLGFAGSKNLRLQAALADIGDAPLSPAASALNSSGAPPSAAEQSRWPAGEARIAFLSSGSESGNHLGVGGYFGPHLNPMGHRFDAWAGTLDARLLLPGRLQFTGSFYRGQALGGLGGGGYKDYAFRPNPNTDGFYFRPLDDVGGWAQLKETLSTRLELNAAFGLDNVFAQELKHYAVTGGSVFQNLARNRSYTGNVIFSPNAYLLFSLEYRYLESSPVLGRSSGTNIIGLAAGYRF
jgi:uncharacterized coiled-coil protein SlyX